MTASRHKYPDVFVIILAGALVLFGSSLTHAEERLLGEIHFPNSGSEAAQPHFIEGMLFLHNFEYEDAARSFRRAQEEDPDFALAYWGEAMTHNHPIWMQQDRDSALEVMKRLAATPEDRRVKAPSRREKDYMHTLEILYGTIPESSGRPKEERDFLYRDATRKLHAKYPDDEEAAVLHGLSILGTAHEGRDFRTYMRAAAVLLKIWDDNKQHPGAAHYLIHSFDDPIHAPLGLPMARAYARIAPAAAHAQHMTSHIFLALGMWQEVIDANRVAHKVRTARQDELGEKAHVCDHYPWWLQYGHLQAGRIDRASKLLETCADRITDTGEFGGTGEERWHYSMMRAHQIIDTERWDQAHNWRVRYEVGIDGSRNYYFASAYAASQLGDLAAAQDTLKSSSGRRKVNDVTYK